jgi:hypothetical protein
MQPLEFLAAVLPSSGVYCVAEFNTKKKEHIFVSTIADMEPAIDKLLGEGRDVYFALANFKNTDSREASNAKSMKALFMDIDLICKGKVMYETKKDAEIAFKTFMVNTEMASLGAPYIVSSGGGFHIYWPFDEDVSIDQWKPVAENFKRLCQQEGLKIDMTCTADAARVLRVPGTKNFKHDNPKNVKLIQVGGTFTLFALDSHIKSKLKTVTYEETLASLPGKKPKAASTASLKLLAENNETLFNNIVEKTKAGTGCAQLAHYIENASDDGMEPLWRGWLSIAQKCEDGGKAAVWLSELHPYTPDRMAQKLREIKGPYPCVKFDSENPGICTGCPHFGKITNPLALGRQLVTETEAKEIIIEPQTPAPNELSEAPLAQPITIQRPAAPRGFSYGKNGAIFKETKTEDADGNEISKQSMVLPFSLFVVNLLKLENEHIVHMLALRPEGTAEIMLPQKAVVSSVETVKCLAEQNIIASYGQGNDKNLFDYVRACVEEASISKRAIAVPDHYGWQSDDTFVFNERVYRPGLEPLHIPMRGLININKACVPTGALADWQKIINMLVAKKLYEVLTFCLVGFGAPLMRYSKFAGVTFHLGSTATGTGKTLSLELAGSVWGHPSRYRISNSTSDVAMKQRAGMLYSMPLISDEITSKNRNDFEWVAQFIFDMSEGIGKSRMEAGADKERENKTYWHSMALLSSNTHIMDYLTGARKHTSEGETRRVLELTLEKKLSWEPHELETLELLKESYGVAGHVYAQYLVDHADELPNFYRKVRKNVKAEFGFIDDERFWIAGCTCLVAGALLADKAGIAKFPMEGIIGVLKGMVQNAKAMVMDNVRTAEDVLNSYTREYYGKMVVVKALEGALAASIGEDGVIDQSITRSEIFGRVEHNVTPGHVDYYLEEQLLKKYCSSMSFGYSDFKKQLEALYNITYLKKDLMSKTKGPQMRVNAMKISRRVTPDEETANPISLVAA